MAVFPFNKRREEEECRELELRDTLRRRGRDAIQDWFVGPIKECIVEAEKHQYLGILYDWLQYALTIQCKIEIYKIERRENIISALQRSIEGLERTSTMDLGMKR